MNRDAAHEAFFFVCARTSYKVLSNARQYLQDAEKSGVVAFIILPGRSDVPPVWEVISHKKRFVFIYASNMLERVLRLAEDLPCVHI